MSRRSLAPSCPDRNRRRAGFLGLAVAVALGLLIGGLGLASAAPVAAPVPAAVYSGVPVLPPAPVNLSVTNVTAGSARVAWTENGTGITNDTIEDFSGRTCTNPLTVRMTAGAVTSYLLGGLLSDRNYSVDVVAWNGTLASPPSGCAAFTTPPAQAPGFSLDGTTVDWQNYSLPGWPGSTYFNNLTGHRRTEDTPVISRYNPTGVLTAYYVNRADQLVAYDLQTESLTVLRSDWPYNISDPSDLSMLYGFQSSRHQLSVLYAEGALQGTGSNHFEWVAWYNLANGTYFLENTTISVSCPCNSVGEPYNNGIGVANDTDGWLFWGNDAYTQLDFYNIYAHRLVRGTGPGLPGWNSVAAVPTADQLIVDENDKINHTVEVLAVNLSGSGANLTVHSELLFSSPLANITGSDLNNQPYFLDPSNGSTTVWGIGNDGGTTYHLLTLDLNSNLSLDRVTGLSDLGAVGTTDIVAGASWDTGNYSLNGLNGVTVSAQYQSLFLDPSARTALYAAGEPWLDALVSSTLLGFNSGGWASPQVSFLDEAGDQNVLFPGYYGTHLVLYWLPAETDEFGGLSPPVNLTRTAESLTSLTVRWQNPDLPGLVNDTVWYGPSCDDLTASRSTGGVATTFSLAGLAAGTSYCVAVQVANATVESARSWPLLATTADLPAEPTGVTVSPIGDGDATVNWTAAPAAAAIVNDTVTLFAGPGCGSELLNESTGGPSAGALISGLAIGATYSVEVTAWNSTGASPPSACVSFTTPGLPPAPVNVTVGSITPSSAEVAWTESPAADAINETVFVFSGAGCVDLWRAFGTPGPASSWSLLGLEAAAPYSVEVVAWNGTGPSPPSSCPGFTTTSGLPSGCAAAVCAIRLSIASGSAGDRERVTATGFVPRSAFSLGFEAVSNGTTSTIASGRTGHYGAFNVTFDVPAAPVGPYLVRVTDAAGDDLSASFVLTNLTAAPDLAAPGTNVSLAGAGFPASTKVVFSLDGASVPVLAKCRTGPEGTFSGCRIVVPDLPGGTYVLVATSGGERARIPFTVA